MEDQVRVPAGKPEVMAGSKGKGNKGKTYLFGILVNEGHLANMYVSPCLVW